MDTILQLPVVTTTDYIVIGGGLKEVIAAIELARAHKQVLLITEHTYLLDDICEGNLCFETKDIQDVELLKQIFIENDLAIISPDHLKKNIEEICDSYGIQLIYNAKVLDQILDGDQKYLRVGGKSGLYGIACKIIMGSNDHNKKIQKESFYMHILNGPMLSSEIKVKVPDVGKDVEISLIPGSYDSRHCLLQVRATESNDDTLNGWKIKCLKAFKYLKDNDLRFSNAQHGRFGETTYHSHIDYLHEYEKGIQLAKELSPSNLVKHKSGNLSQREIISYNQEMEYRNYDQIPGSDLAVGSSEKYDVIVVGGGTAGSMTALHAARNGLRTLLLEMNTELGGTSTIGGVSTYWFGTRFKEVEEVDQAVEEIYQRYSIDRKEGIWSHHDDWNPGIKSLVIEQLCLEAGVTIRKSTITFAVTKNVDINRVTGVLASTGQEIIFAKSDYIVDGTGDGDVAAFSGAKYIYGSDRDYLTFWASLAQYNSPATYKNNFTSTLIVSDPLDYTRFIRSSRLKGNDTYDHGSYVSPRESRHICGRYRLTLEDIINYRTYKDGIYTCYSNYDPKGKSSSDMVYAGVLPPQVSIQIPLSCLLAVDEDGKDLDGIVVIGKAISCTHDAFPSIRMQSDLMHQGAVVGNILALAVGTMADISKLDMGTVQSLVLKFSGDNLSLPFYEEELSDTVKRASGKDRTHWVDLSFLEEVKSHERALRIMSADSETIRPMLLKKLNKIESNNNEDYLMMAKYLVWHGDDREVDIIINSIIDTLNKNTNLPFRQASVNCVQLLPDHGVMPEVVHELNLLAYSQNPDIIKPFELVFEKLINGEREYHDNKKGVYHYIEAFPYVAERTGIKEFIPFLKELSQLSEFKEVMKKEDSASLLTERLYILLLSLYRALARCGDQAGYHGLIQMLSIDSLPIAASACKELEALTKLNCGINVNQFEKWVSENSDSLQVQLIRKKVS